MMKISLFTLTSNCDHCDGEFKYHIDDYSPTHDDPIEQAREAFELLACIKKFSGDEILTRFENKDERVVVIHLDSSPIVWRNAPLFVLRTDNQKAISFKKKGDPRH